VSAFAARGSRLALATLGLFVFLAISAPWLLPDPNATPDPIGARLLAPSFAHLLGTDALSRDLFARLAHGGAISLQVGLLAAILATLVGGLVGLTAGALGGPVDQLLMRTADALATVPRAFALLFVVAAWPELPLGAFILLLGVTGWYAVARIVRAEAVRLMATDAISAARALGAGRSRIIFRHLLPNVAGQLAVATALGVGEAMLLEAGLSFLGAGVRPPTASWGGMIHDGKDVLLTSPWATLAPGLALTAVVLATNRLGDALRDAFDPRTR
jgi:ABC-type dipeptide/oligopeptide/nickel transport system permease subunit